MTTCRKREYAVAFECDSCGDMFDTDHRDFREALDMLKDNDWAVRNCDGTWVHVCPDCQKDEVE
jgi:Fe2+ or Zn2+ uptake regulation protein